MFIFKSYSSRNHLYLKFDFCTFESSCLIASAIIYLTRNTNQCFFSSELYLLYLSLFSSLFSHRIFDWNILLVATVKELVSPLICVYYINNIIVIIILIVWFILCRFKNTADYELHWTEHWCLWLSSYLYYEHIYDAYYVYSDSTEVNVYIYNNNP